MYSDILYESRPKLTRPESVGDYSSPMTVKQAAKEASRDPVAWVQVLGPVVLTFIILAMWGHLQYTRARVEQSSSVINTGIQAFASQSGKASHASADAVLRAIEPQIKLLTEQNERSIADRAHLNDKLREAEQKQAQVQRALENAQRSFNEARDVLRRLEARTPK